MVHWHYAQVIGVEDPWSNLISLLDGYLSLLHLWWQNTSWYTYAMTCLGCTLVTAIKTSCWRHVRWKIYSVLLFLMLRYRETRDELRAHLSSSLDVRFWVPISIQVELCLGGLPKARHKKVLSSTRHHQYGLHMRIRLKEWSKRVHPTTDSSNAGLMLKRTYGMTPTPQCGNSINAKNDMIWTSDCYSSNDLLFPQVL